MELKEKVAYLKGLMEGMEYDVSTKEGKLMAAVVETLDAMAARTATRKIMPMSMRRACTRLPAPTAAKWCA